MTENIELGKEMKLNYILFEPNLQNQLTEVVQKKTTIEALTLLHLQSITDETIKNKEDYFDFMMGILKALNIDLNE